MNQPASLSWHDLHELFSVVMCVDESMTIIYASETLAKFLPQSLQGRMLLEAFDTLRPTSLVTFRDGVDSIGSLCLLTAKNKQFAVRGQLMQIDYQGCKALCFCGSPWLSWMNSYAPEIHLRLDDFSSQDVQLDQLLFMSTEKKMVEDLEKMNSDLHLAKRQLEEAQEVQRQFFAQINHEIRTPLNGVMSALSLLQALDHDPEHSRFLQLAQSSSKNLMQVINYVLSVSKLELSEHQEQVVFSWEDLIRSTVDVIKAKAQQKSLPVKLEFSSQLPEACLGMPNLLRQTVLNLLINAIKFTIEGEITVRVTMVKQVEELRIIRLAVTDTGVGVAEDQLGKIFEPFWSTIPKDIVDIEQGTGLGLDIVRRNVHSMGGQVHVDSVLGEGTTFSFEVPVKLPLGGAEFPFRDADDEYVIPALTGHVLLVDDNETNRLLGALILESLGLDVTSVDSGYEAVRAVRESQFDLVLMDINMPDIDGLEATRQICELNLGERPIIVALTAFVDDGEKAACLEVGMSGYLTKPMVREDLARALAIWLPSDDSVSEAEFGDGCNHSNAEGIDIAGIKSATVELIDSQVLSELLKQIGPDNLDLVINKVKIEVSQRWQELEQAESAADTDKIRLHVHSLGSIFRSVGLLAIGDSLAEIETCLRIGEVPVPGWLQDVRHLRDNSLIALEKELAAP